MTADKEPIIKQRVVEAFTRLFGASPACLTRAPGRVNLIGEHTDYSDGFVLPMAIDRAIWVALRPRADGQVIAHSLHFPEPVTFTLSDIRRGGPSWGEYLKGVAWALQGAGYALRGWEGVVDSDVPIGAGLSSSAALEMAIARAFAFVSDLPWEPAIMARLAQQAENRWVGVNCGIMDQMVSALGRAGHALLIDCRSLETQAVPLPPGTAVAILDTGTRRGLRDSAYNERRAQCEAAARFFGVAALRDVTLERLEREALGLEAVILRRARHVVTENQRTLAAAAAMARGDAATLGRLMKASHASLRDDFAVSSRELDIITDCANNHAACYGARMTGAGFGGCAVALVREDKAEDFVTAVAACYRNATGLEPIIYLSQAADGAGVITGVAANY